MGQFALPHSLSGIGASSRLPGTALTRTGTHCNSATRLPAQLSLEGVMHFFTTIHFPQRNRLLAGSLSAGGIV